MTDDPVLHALVDLVEHLSDVGMCGPLADAYNRALGVIRGRSGLSPKAREFEMPNAIWLAKFFHDAYERLAPQFGYATRPETRVFDHESPNGRLMAAVCEELRRTLQGQE